MGMQEFFYPVCREEYLDTMLRDAPEMLDLLPGLLFGYDPWVRAGHAITIPDRVFGRELRTTLRDDEVDTVEGDHSEVADFQRIFGETKPVTVGSHGGERHLHDPAEFLTYLHVIFWPALDEPLRSILPPVFDGVEVLRSVWADMTFNPNAIY